MVARRTLLQALAIVPAVIVAPAHASPASEIHRLIAKHAAAKAATERHDAEVLDPAYERYQRAIESIPHATVRWKQSQCFAGETWSTADKRRIKEAQYFLDPSHATKVAPAQLSYEEACRALLRASKHRDGLIEKAAISSGYLAASAENERLCDHQFAVLKAVLACPVTTPADFLTKMTFVWEDDRWDLATAQEAVANDINRLTR